MRGHLSPCQPTVGLKIVLRPWFGLADFLGLPVFGSLFAGSAVGVEWYNGIGRKSVTSSYDSCMDTY